MKGFTQNYTCMTTAFFNRSLLKELLEVQHIRIRKAMHRNFSSLSPQTPCEIETTVSSHLALPEGGDLLLSGTVIILLNQLVFNKFGS